MKQCCDLGKILIIKRYKNRVMEKSFKIKELFLNYKKLFEIDKAETVLEGIVKSSFLNLIARGFGYLKYVAIAVLIGFNHQTDSFFMALSLIGFFIIFVDVFDSVGVPQLVKARMESEQAFNSLSRFLFAFTTILSLAIVGLSILLLPLVLKVPAGFGENALNATKVSFLMLVPYLFFSFYFHHFGAILRSQRRFTAYFVGELIFSALSCLIFIIGYLTFKDYRVLPISFSLAQLLACLYMLYVGRKYIQFSLYFDQRTRKILSHFFLLVSVYGIFHLYIVVDKAFASYLEEKAVSALNYGLLLALIPRGVLKIEHMAITSISEVMGSIKKLNFYLKKLLIIILPISISFFIFSPFIVKILFGYGAFSGLDVELTSTALRFYAISLPLFFFWPLIYRVFQIREKLISIGLVALLGVIVNAFFNYLFVFKIKLGLIGICLGTFLSYVLICLLGYVLLTNMEQRR